MLRFLTAGESHGKRLSVIVALAARRAAAS